MPAIRIPGADGRPTDLVTLTVQVDGDPLPGTFSVVAIDIYREINRVPAASLVLHDGDAAKQDFAVSAGDRFVPGRRLRIEGGYGSDEKLLFEGIITGQRIQVRRSGDSRLHVEAHDASFRMTLGRRSAYYSESTNSEVFEEIVGRYPGLSADVEPTGTSFGEVVQHQVSDWDFVVSRAEAEAMFCLPDDGRFRVARPDLGQPPAATLIYGSNIFDVDLEVDARTQFAAVSAGAWDQADQALAISELSDEASPPQGNLDGATLAEASGSVVQQMRHDGSLDQQQIDAWARSAMLKSRFGRIRGTVRFQGTHVVRPGALVELRGLGDRFNGRAFVSGVRHALGRGDWETTVQIGLPTKWHRELFDIDAPPAGGVHAAVNGLMVGLITQVQDDPQGEQRVRVRLPLVSDHDEGAWARLATADAGSDRGWVFRPEIDDEVVVGFLDGDPNQPVVLGALHSSSKPAPIPSSDDNHQKGLITRSGIKLVFHDDTVALAIETPNGNKIELDDDQGRVRVTDESGNSYTMESGGITLQSVADIVIQAQGDVRIEGTSIQVKATATFTAEGSGGAKLSSGGTTEVKGSLVRIN